MNTRTVSHKIKKLALNHFKDHIEESFIISTIKSENGSDEPIHEDK